MSMNYYADARNLRWGRVGSRDLRFRAADPAAASAVRAGEVRT
jgi:hypothetical protein